MTTDIVLIRHGETDWNVERRYQGSSDTALNELGMEQARALAEEMRGEEWDVVISSPLKRVMSTAIPIAEALGKGEGEIIPDPRLLERSYGAAEGYTLDERARLFPGDTWEGLESHAQLEQRAMGAIEDYVARYPNQRLMMAAHGTWITAVLEVLTRGEFGYGKSVILNTSRTFLPHKDGEWEVGEIAVADHLAALT